MCASDRMCGTLECQHGVVLGARGPGGARDAGEHQQSQNEEDAETAGQCCPGSGPEGLPNACFWMVYFICAVERRCASIPTICETSAHLVILSNRAVHGRDAWRSPCRAAAGASGSEHSLTFPNRKQRQI